MINHGGSEPGYEEDKLGSAGINFIKSEENPSPSVSPFAGSVLWLSPQENQKVRPHLYRHKRGKGI